MSNFNPLTSIQSFAGNPNGNVASTQIGDICFDTVNNHLFVASTTGSSGSAVWQDVTGSGGGGANFLSYAGSPTGNVASTVVGQTCLDTSNNHLYSSSAIGTAMSAVWHDVTGGGGGGGINETPALFVSITSEDQNYAIANNLPPNITFSIGSSATGVVATLPDMTQETNKNYQPFTMVNLPTSFYGISINDQNGSSLTTLEPGQTVTFLPIGYGMAAGNFMLTTVNSDYIYASSNSNMGPSSLSAYIVFNAFNDITAQNYTLPDARKNNYQGPTTLINETQNIINIQDFTGEPVNASGGNSVVMLPGDVWVIQNYSTTDNFGQWLGYYQGNILTSPITPLIASFEGVATVDISYYGANIFQSLTEDLTITLADPSTIFDGFHFKFSTTGAYIVSVNAFTSQTIVGSNGFTSFYTGTNNQVSTLGFTYSAALATWYVDYTPAVPASVPNFMGIVNNIGGSLALASASDITMGAVINPAITEIANTANDIILDATTGQAVFVSTTVVGSSLLMPPTNTTNPFAEQRPYAIYMTPNSTSSSNYQSVTLKDNNSSPINDTDGRPVIMWPGDTWEVYYNGNSSVARWISGNMQYLDCVWASQTGFTSVPFLLTYSIMANRTATLNFPPFSVEFTSSDNIHAVQAGGLQYLNSLLPSGPVIQYLAVSNAGSTAIGVATFNNNQGTDNIIISADITGSNFNTGTAILSGFSINYSLP